MFNNYCFFPSVILGLHKIDKKPLLAPMLYKYIYKIAQMHANLN